MLRIKSLRLENNLSQRALAEHIKCSQKSIDYWEKGIAEPTAHFIVALADCFGCTTDYLLGREDDFGNVNVESDLDETEQNVLYIYRSLNPDSREKLLDYMGYLSSKK